VLGAVAIAAVAGVIYEAWTNNWVGIRDFVGNIISSIKNTIASLLDYLAERNLMGVQTNWRDQIAGVGQGVGAAVDAVKSKVSGVGNFINDAMAGGADLRVASASPGVKAATAKKDAATADVQVLQDAAAQRKADFDLAHVARRISST
jgi:hypothetical protein